MQLELICAWNNLTRLLRFLVLYAGSLAALFYVLPLVAFVLQTVYESMDGFLKLSALALFVLAISAWQYRNWRQDRAEGAAVPAGD